MMSLLRVTNQCVLICICEFHFSKCKLICDSEASFTCVFRFECSYLRCSFLGEANKIRVPGGSAPRVAVVRRTVECKESRIGKQPILVPSNVTLTMDGQYLKAKGPLGELDLTYPREIVLDKEESGALRVRKAVETRRANQMHGLFRHFSLFSPLVVSPSHHLTSAILYSATCFT